CAVTRPGERSREPLQALQALGERGLELGIVSNFASLLYEILLGLGIDRFFESGTLSSPPGVAKPSLQIFKRALAKHGVSPGEALHIGNSLREDVQGASAAGIKAVLLHRQEEAVSGVETIRTLTDVIPLVDRR